MTFPPMRKNVDLNIDIKFKLTEIEVRTQNHITKIIQICVNEYGIMLITTAGHIQLKSNRSKINYYSDDMFQEQFQVFFFSVFEQNNSNKKYLFASFIGISATSARCTFHDV